ncbi:ABC transporter permease subunit [Leucobacter insecticola]|uniref:ABC transporter permease subunit n=1 Tax=Leucobacter insecticola TaxID=2714934 RepID=A0A6G8FG55_9MICO|nr:ABC transporter permease subunit [Leucobacter insecticola]QIM15334.1 ABC transporter permease subunit [Leucobacter insecticola]
MAIAELNTPTAVLPVYTAPPSQPSQANGTGKIAPAAVRQSRRRDLRNLLGSLPYFAFIALFLAVPLVVTLVKAFVGADGQLTFENVAQLGKPQYLAAVQNSVNLSLFTAGVGGILGLILGWALTQMERPAWLHRTVTSLAAVASQMGGPPLAYAFISLIGAQGLLTVWLQQLFGFSLNEVLPVGSFWGIAVAYLYFQMPLMAILAIPAIQGVRKEWVESGQSLGAGGVRVLFSIVMPILAPSLAGGFLLLFANAFSGYAAAYAMAGGAANLLPISIGYFLSGNVLLNQGLASALISVMVLVMLLAMGLRGVLLKRATRWTA